ncbi:MAG: UDP-N-acetylglucosamine 2-epimerase (non-hydrolyzing) [Thermoproteota archaeon]|nr:MAG: UDP-N-acetylglucosamine 2-epimerase (non-hydrolyzing) [Candidatus Korarchaeota archaeon]
MLPRLLFFVGTRPEIIKAAPLFHTLRKSSGVQVDLVHTGQHYDWNMSGIFIEELGLPTPLYHLGIGSGSQPYQIYKIIEKTEEVVGTYLPDAILAVGDTNSTLATAIMASKMDIPFVHVESGLRSFDPTMPEEINRKVADHVASLNFAPTERAASNLLNEGCSPERTFVTGNTVVDALLKMLPKARAESNILKKLKVDPSKFLMTVTVHRRENADNPERLESIVNALIEL